MSQKLMPPVAKRVRRTTTLHGETLIDDYFWMRDRSDPDVMAYIEAENAYTDAAMARELVVAVGTVKRHVSNILGKLHVESRLEAVTRARDLGLV